MNFERIVDRVRKLHEHVPGFDPANGNESAKVLFVLEAPGPGAVKSGIISVNNNDPSARNFSKQMQEAGIEPEQIAIWNIVPWYIGNGAKIRAANAADIKEGASWLAEVINAMPNLETIVLVGEKARGAHVAISQHAVMPILSIHHPSAQSMNGSSERWEDNVAVLKNVARRCLNRGGRRQ